MIEGKRHAKALKGAIQSINCMVRVMNGKLQISKRALTTVHNAGREVRTAHVNYDLECVVRPVSGTATHKVLKYCPKTSLVRGSIPVIIFTGMYG